MRRSVSAARAAVLACLAAVAPSAARAALVVPIAHPRVQEVADRVHSLAVLVRARAFIADRGEDGEVRVREALSTASGVLIGSGFVLTELGAVTLPLADGTLDEASEIEVLIDRVGPLTARLAAGDTDLDIALLRLPDEASGLAGAELAEEAPDVGDEMVAVAADGHTLTAVGVLLERMIAADSGASLLRTTGELPRPFWGGPLFDGEGRLAGVNVRPHGTGATAVPASLLRSLLARSVPQDGI